MDEEEPSIERLVEEARRLEEQGATEQALDSWRAVISREQDPDYLCKFGMLALDSGRWSEAEEAFASAIKIAPTEPEAYEGMGILLEQLGQYERAKAYLTKSLDLEKTASAFTVLGCSQMGLDEFDAARDSFRAALKIDPNYEEAYYNMALTFTGEQLGESVTLLRQAIEIDPAYAKAHREVGWRLYKTGQPQEGKTHLMYAIDLNPSDGWSYIYLGNLMWRAGELDSAERMFKRAGEVWPDSSVPYWSLAMFYEYSNRPGQAQPLYEKALREDPADPVVYRRYGLLLKDLGLLDKAKNYLELAIDLNPGDRVAQSALASLKPCQHRE